MSSSVPRYYSSSELSSLSDSDWLDISSNHDSEDGNSSDFENDTIHRPPSRVSSASFESSQGDEGEVDTWEGFVEGAPTDVARDSDIIHSNLTDAAVATLNDNTLQEEERVKEALDQSMMSTLSASRSSSAHTRTSLNDLRLSFPDPLSSQETLSRTPFEQLSTPSLDDLSDGNDNSSFPSPSEGDPGSLPTPEVSHSDWCHCSHAPWQGLNVVLHGLPSHISFVRDFFAAASRGFHHAEGCDGIPRLNLEAPLDGKSSLGVSVYIQSTGAPMLQPKQIEASPSLAITVYPFASISLPAHSLYLPVIADPANQDQARAAWKLSGISPERTLLVKADKRLPAVDEPIDPIRAYEALNRLRIKASKSRRLDVTPAMTPALTLTSIFSLLVGIAIYAACRGTSIAGTPTTIDHNTTTALHQLITHSAVGTSLSLINTKTSLLVPTVKNTAISVVSQNTAISKFTPAEACISVNVKPPVSWSDRLRSSKDLVARPISSLLPYSAARVETTVEVIVIEDENEGVKQIEPEPLLSDLFNNRVEEMKEEFNELSVALDDLMKSISVQTASLMEQSKESAQVFKDHIQRRHERARTRAKLVRNVGERVFQSAGKEVKDRVENARQRAQALRQCSPIPFTGDRGHGGCWGQARLKRFGF